MPTGNHRRQPGLLQSQSALDGPDWSVYKPQAASSPELSRARGYPDAFGVAIGGEACLISRAPVNRKPSPEFIRAGLHILGVPTR